MVVRSHNTELGYELIATVPYAYYLHTIGELEGTVSGTGSEPFYFFSPHHQIDPTPRDFAHTAAASKEIPNMWIHKPNLNKEQWIPPPYKEHYAPLAVRFDKPTVVIYNRFNVEWSRPPINYFDLPVLRSMFKMLSKKYTVVYFNVRGEESLEDNAHSMDLGDYEMIRSEFPQVRVIHDIVEDTDLSYNECQLRIFAGCERFVTMNGAPSILASHFGGENIIYTKECRELGSAVNSFYNWYPDFGGSAIKVVHTYQDLLRTISDKWVRELPLINILVRCHDRKQSLKRLWDSIEAQGYRNWRVIASYDNERTWKYLVPYRFEKVAVEPEPKPKSRPYGDDYKGFLASNLYLNALADRVDRGYIMYLDDDDYLAPGALSRIAKNLSEDNVTLWRATSKTGKPIPSDENFGKIVAGDISGIAFAYHSKHKELARWEPWRRGDFRVIRNLSNHLTQTWINEELTKISSALPEKGTKEYIDDRIAERRLRAAEINAAVSRKMANT